MAQDQISNPFEQNVNLRSVHDVLTDREDNSDPTDQNPPSTYIQHRVNRENTVGVPRRKFFYDAQLARLLIQIGSKCFGGYQVISGYQTDGKTRLTDVPLVYGTMSRVVAQLFGGGSDNVVTRLPIMSYTMTAMQRKREEIRDPQAVQQYVVHYRQRDPDGNLLVNQPGKLIVVERFMPVPYDVEIALVIWASNTDQQMQLVEQLSAVFNPDMEIMISNSPLDWTSPTRVLHDGRVSFEEIVQSENPDPQPIATMNFTATVRMSLPVRVYDAALIHEIHVPIHDLEDFGYFYFGDNIEIPTMPTLSDVVIRATEEEILDHGNQ